MNGHIRWRLWGKFMSLKNCSKVLRSKAGVGLLPVVLGLSAVSVGTVAIVSQMGLSSLKRSVSALSEWETNLFNQKALTLGGYFVAHNLVLCKEDGWAAHGGTAGPIRCIWGGNLHEPKITSESFDVLNYKHNSNGGLELEIENTDNLGKTVITKLELQLIDWTKNPSFRTMVGTIPAWNGLADDDQFLVTMKAVTMLAVDSTTSKPILKVGAIRRPLGTPDLQILSAGGSVCTFECDAGDTLSPHPECRGPLVVPPAGAAAKVTARMTNFGPGALYKLKYMRTTAFDQAVYPGRPEQVEVIDALEGQEVIMPGQVISRDLPRICFSPIRNFMTTSIEQEATGLQATATVNTVVSVASAFRNLSRERFDISVSRFDPQEMVDNPTFASTYDPFNPATYTPNLTQSVIEPKRIGVELPAFEVQSPQEIITETTTTVVVRPRPIEVWGGGDGGGDGGN